MAKVLTRHPIMNKEMEHSVGIDLGTTNSAVARIVGNDPVVLEPELGRQTLPSVVRFEPDGDSVSVGKEAANLKTKHPDQVIESVKRRIGEQRAVARVNGTEYSPEEVSALIIEKLKTAAERELGRSITNAVITVPAYFSNEEREATKRAGEIAGLEVDRILNEPTAAMLSHGIRGAEDTAALVYDLGGGTFDASLVTAADGVFEVVATDGLSHHGGDDWDARLAGQIQRMVESETGRSVDEQGQAMSRIWDAARQAKHELSNKTSTTIRLPFLFEGYDFEKSITRDQFDELTSELLEKTIETCDNVLNEAARGVDDIEKVLLVGGSTRMPQVERRLREVFGDKVQRSKSPDETVAKGAAIQAGIIQDALPVIEEDGSATLRAQEEQTLDTHEDTQYALPDVYDDVVLVDVTSNPLGTEVIGDNFAKVIRRNTSIPVKRTERFATTEDNQTSIVVKVYQGESMTASENELLDEFIFSGLPRLPAGEAKIDVIFRINENGILEVTAESVQRGHADSITVKSGVEYSEQQIEEMRSNLPNIT